MPLASRLNSMAVVAALSLALSLALSPTAANAGGFAKKSVPGASGYASGSSTTSVRTKSRYVDYYSNTSAFGETSVRFKGRVAEAYGAAANDTRLKVKGKATYKQWKRAKAKVYAKGRHVMAKARSENLVHVKVAGKSYLVSREVARAMARHTPLGTQAAAASETYISAGSSRYIGSRTSSASKAHVRVINR